MDFLFSRHVQTGLLGPPSLYSIRYQGPLSAVNRLNFTLNTDLRLASNLGLSSSILPFTFCAFMAYMEKIPKDKFFILRKA
jgi:hypothetical protein